MFNFAVYALIQFQNLQNQHTKRIHRLRHLLNYQQRERQVALKLDTRHLYNYCSHGQHHYNHYHHLILGSIFHHSHYLMNIHRHQWHYIFHKLKNQILKFQQYHCYLQRLRHLQNLLMLMPQRYYLLMLILKLLRYHILGWGQYNVHHRQYLQHMLFQHLT